MALYLKLSKVIQRGNQFTKQIPFQSFRNYITEHQRSIIGEREVVGPGHNSEYNYLDHPAFPFPAIRFREKTSEVLALREKEKGDWHRLTKEEKKVLYRASFCQTFAEMQANTGHWKSTVGFALMWISAGMWLFLGIRWLWHTELPSSFTESSQKAQLKRMIDLEMNPITGLASKWDYEKGEWK